MVTQRLLLFLGVSLAACVAPLPSQAQGVIPDAPQIADILPPSGQRGATVEVALNGQRLDGTKQLMCRFSAYPDLAAPVARGVKAEVLSANDNQVKARLTLAQDAPSGLHEIRALTAQGVTAPQYFYVSQYAQAPEKEPNNGISEANLIAVPSTIAGQINGGEDQDTFAIQAKAGETLVFDVEGFKRYSPAQNQQEGISYLDSFLMLRDGNGRELAYDDDDSKLDAFLAFKFPADGKYFVTLRDSLYRGRGDFHYRLTVGPRPTITAIFPPGGPKGTRQVATVYGYNLNASGATEMRSAIPLTETAGVQEFRITTAGGISNPFPVVASADFESPEVEPNNRVQDATQVTIPVTCSGKFDSLEDVDGFRFQAQGGQTLIFESMAARLGSAVDTYLIVMNRGGKVLARDDDGGGGGDARIQVTIPQTDEYVVLIRNQAKSGHGPQFYYRLTVRPLRPALAAVFKQEGQNRQGGRVMVPVDGIGVPAGSNVEFELDLGRQEGQGGDVAVSLSLPPDMKGLSVERLTRTNPTGGPTTPGTPGLRTSVEKAPLLKNGQNTATLRLVADATVPPGTYMNAYLKLAGLADGKTYVVNKPLWLTVAPKQ